MNTLPKQILSMIISFSFSNRAVCRRWRDAVKYSFAEYEFGKIVSCGTEDVLRLFLAQHPSADWCKGLYHACKKGNKSIAQIMVQRGARSLYISLYIACKKGYKSIVKFLVQCGADDWDYGLRGACFSGSKSLVLLMIRCGATELNEPLIVACKKGYKSIVKILIQCGADDFNRGLFYACKHGSMGVVKYLSRYVDRETYSEYLNKYCC